MLNYSSSFPDCIVMAIWSLIRLTFLLVSAGHLKQLATRLVLWVLVEEKLQCCRVFRMQKQRIHSLVRYLATYFQNLSVVQGRQIVCNLSLIQQLVDAICSAGWHDFWHDTSCISQHYSKETNTWKGFLVGKTTESVYLSLNSFLLK